MRVDSGIKYGDSNAGSLGYFVGLGDSQAFQIPLIVADIVRKRRSRRDSDGSHKTEDPCGRSGSETHLSAEANGWTGVDTLHRRRHYHRLDALGCFPRVVGVPAGVLRLVATT